MYRAKLALTAKRFDDVLDEMRIVVGINPQLTREEQRLLSAACKNLLRARRSSLRKICSIAEEECDRPFFQLKEIKLYRSKIKKEIIILCDEVFQLVDCNLVPNAKKEDDIAFCYKFKGDFYRYMVEITSGNARKYWFKKCGESYRIATASSTQLEPTHPVRLGLAVNFSLFQRKIMNDTDAAISTARMAFEEAMDDLEGLEEEEFAEITPIMRVLRNNLCIWEDETPPDSSSDT